jgi:hypothetical protein
MAETQSMGNGLLLIINFHHVSTTMTDPFNFPTSTSNTNLSPVLIAVWITAQGLSETAFHRVAGIRGRTSVDVHAEIFLFLADRTRS